MSNERILAHHLRRKAVIYIRQSTGHQVLTNQESQLMQRAMKEHALRLGWAEESIETVESDTGSSAKTTDGRTGYKNLLAELAVGEVGIVLSYESTRLSRNCSDWYPLLDLCTLHQCLIGDRDGVYDPATPNGRLLLGMKGIVSELELHTLRGRLNAGIDNKAKRGELATPLPTGYVRLEDGAIVKDPDLQVQEAIELVFRTFLELRSSGKVVRHLRKHAILLPCRTLAERRPRFVPPGTAAVLRMLRNPTYAGAFVFGRSHSVPSTDPLRPGMQIRRLPQDKWRVLLKDRFAGYIDWDTFQRIQDILTSNYAHHRPGERRGVPRNGPALLAGICYCGHCGHQMSVRYGRAGHYRCRCIQPDLGPKPHSESIRVEYVDPYVQQSFFEALSPVELDLYEAAYQRTKEQHAQIRAAQERQLQRLRYEVGRARRQYDQSDPENRLVTLELERRWESALQALAQAEQRYELDERHMQAEAQRRIPLEIRTQFATIGQAIPGLWPALPIANRKAMLRCLVDKVVLKRQRPGERLLVRIVWRGGAHTDKEHNVPTANRHPQTNAEALSPRVMELVEQGLSDKQITEQLRTEGYRSPRKDQLRAATVSGLRRQQGTFRRTTRRGAPKVGGALTVSRVAQLLGVHRQWIYSLLYKGVIKLDRDPEYNMYLFPRDPETLAKLRQLRDGLIHNIVFSKEHQDA